MNLKFMSSALCWILLSFSQVSAQDLLTGADVSDPNRGTSDPYTSIIPGDRGDLSLFDSDDILEVTLSFYLQDFLKSRDEQTSADALFACVNDRGDPVSRQIRITTWDGARSRICDLPPLMLIFNENVSFARTNPSLAGVRLVTCCKSEPQYERYVLLEYLAYKLYNKVTPYSFKTRLARVTYVDRDQPDVTFSSYAFLIEDMYDMASRNNAIVCEDVNVNPEQLNKDHMVRTAVFNYMIGNTDWNVTGWHNTLHLLGTGSSAENLVPVAYDFDFAGLVNACYAAPSPLLPLESVRERAYVGLCAPGEDFQDILDEFDKLQGAIYKTIRNFDLLTETEKEQVKSYLDGYFSQTKDPAMLIGEFNATCRKL